VNRPNEFRGETRHTKPDDIVKLQCDYISNDNMLKITPKLTRQGHHHRRVYLSRSRGIGKQKAQTLRLHWYTDTVPPFKSRGPSHQGHE